MLVTGSVNKVSKIHERSSGDVSPFQYEYAKLDANVCDGGMNVEQRMTCRSRSFHFRAATALHTSERSVWKSLLTSYPPSGIKVCESEEAESGRDQEGQAVEQSGREGAPRVAARALGQPKAKRPVQGKRDAE